MFSVLSPIPFGHSVVGAETFTVCPSGCGFTSIQDAIDEVVDGDVVEVGAGTYEENLSIPVNGYPTGLTIVGVDPGVVLQSVLSDPVVLVQSGNFLTFENLTLEQTNADRVVENYGNLTLSTVAVTGGSVLGVHGAGIYNEGTLNIDADSEVAGNDARAFSPGSLDQSNEQASGTTAHSTALFQGFTPTGNTLKRVELEFRAGGSYGGSTETIRIYPVVGGVPDLSSPLGEAQRTITTTELSSGQSGWLNFDFVPAVRLDPGSSYAIEWLGGGVSWYFNNSTYGPPGNPYPGGVSWNAALVPTPDTDYHFRTYEGTFVSDANGGGIYNNAGTVTINDSTVTGNTAYDGGGVHNFHGTVNITSSDVTFNEAWNEGGGLVESTLTTTNLNNATVSGNTAHRGGGIYVDFGTLNADLSTITGNTAAVHGGGIYVDNGGVVFQNGSITFNTAASGRGGGVYNNYGSSLELTNASVDDNAASDEGGGIITPGYTEITGGTVSNNTAGFEGGGVHVANFESIAELVVDGATFSGNTADRGGAIYSAGGTVDLSNATVGPNNVANYGGGGGIRNEEGSLNLSDTSVDGNQGYGSGGGIHTSGYDGGAEVTILGGSLSNNQAFTWECDGTCPGLGGGLANSAGPVRLDQVSVVGNTVDGFGGGVYNGSGGETLILGTRISENAAFESVSYADDGSGGGVFTYGELTIDSTAISSNASDVNGGGIAACDSDPMTITNSTISGNSALTGGGLSNDACGSGSLMDTQLNNVTITANTAYESGGGIDNTSAPLLVDNSIVAGNQIDDGLVTADDCAGAAASGGGFNLIGVAGCGIADGVDGNQVGSLATPLDPFLGVLADNGGSTETHALLTGSPAIDNGDPGDPIEGIPSTCESVDQRGISRPQGAACDIGAFELDEVIIPPFVEDLFFYAYGDNEGPTEPGVVDVGITEIPIEKITGTDSILGASPLSSIPLSSIPLSSIDLGASPLSSIPLSSIPLSSIPLSSIPLSSIPLSSIPLSSIGGWDAILDGTIYEDEPSQNVTLKQVLDLDPALLSGVDFGDVSIAGSPLSSISLPSLALGSATLDDLGEPGLCDDVPSGFNCTQNSTVLSLEVQGAPLSSIPLSSIPLNSIDLATTPLSSIPLSSIPLSSIPLSSIPLSSIPLSSIDLLGAPLSSIPLASIPLSSIPLSSIDIAGSPLSSIPLSSINVGGDFCTFMDDGSTDWCAFLGIGTSDTLGDLVAALGSASNTIADTPLSSIPLSSIDLSTMPLASIPLRPFPCRRSTWRTSLPRRSRRFRCPVSTSTATPPSVPS